MMFDLIFWHPPYYNLVHYSMDPRDLSNCADYGDYIDKIKYLFLRFLKDNLESNGYLALLIGDIRDKDGTYYSLGFDIVNLGIGSLEQVFTHISIVQDFSNTVSFYPNIMHEQLLLFRK